MGLGDPIAIGLNSITVQDDLVTWVAGAEITADDVRAGHVIFEPILARYGHICIMCNLTELSRFDAEARRVHNEWHKQMRPHYLVALLGGGIVSRALVRLALSAAQVVSRDKRTRFDFFDSEAKALAWLTKERVRLAALRARAEEAR